MLVYQRVKTETTKQKLLALVVAFPRQCIHCSFVDETNFAKSPCRIGKVLWVELLQDFWLCQIHLTNPEVCGDVGAKYDQHYQHYYSVASGVAKIMTTKIGNNYIRYISKKLPVIFECLGKKFVVSKANCAKRPNHIANVNGPQLIIHVPSQCRRQCLVSIPFPKIGLPKRIGNHGQ